MKNNRRIVALVLSIAMMVSMIPVSVMADEEEIIPAETVETEAEPAAEQEEQIPEEQAEDESVPEETAVPADAEESDGEPAETVIDEISDFEEATITAANDGEIGTMNPITGIPSGGQTDPRITYIDGDGTLRYLTGNVTSLTGEEKTLSSGWYIADGEMDFVLPVEIDGDVKIILADGCSVNAIQFITANEDGDTIRFYGQSEGTGVLSISSTGVSDGISMENIYFNGGTVNVRQNTLNEAVQAEMVTINRGKVNINCNADDNSSIAGIQTSSLTMRGGELTVSGFNTGIEGTDNGNLTFAGGVLSITYCKYGIVAPVATTVYLIGGNIGISGTEAGIDAYANSDVYLKCSAATDSITVSSFDVAHDVTVDGMNLKTTDDSIVVSGVLSPAEIAAVSGKTLVRVPGSVSYIDENGVELTIADPVYLNGYENSLTGGFYVAAGNMDLGKISISGDVRIILAKSCDIESEGFSHVGSFRPDGNPVDILTFYGQKNNEQDAGTIVINGSGNSGINDPDVGINADAVNFFGGNVVINTSVGVQVDNGNVTVHYESVNDGVNGKVIIRPKLIGITSRIPSVCKLMITGESSYMYVQGEINDELPSYAVVQGIGLETTVNGGNLIINLEANSDVCGIYAPVKLDGGQLRVTVTCSGSNTAVGIYSDSFIDSDVENKEYNCVNVTGDDFSVTATSRSGDAYGIIAGNDVRLTGGNVNITGGIARWLPRDIDLILACESDGDKIRIDSITEFDVYENMPDDSPYDVVDPDPDDPYEGDIVGPTVEPTVTPEPYPFGRGELTIKVKDGYAIKNSDNEVFFGTVDEERYDSLTGTDLTKAEMPDIRITGYSVELNGSIGVKPVIKLPYAVYEDPSAKIVFTVNGEEREVAVKGCYAHTSDGINYFCSYICSLSAKQMTDVVNIRFVSDSGIIELASEGDHEFTVLKYAEYIRTTHYVGSHETTDLVYSLLNYGAKAQKFFKYGDQGAAIEQYLDDHSVDFYNCPKSTAEAEIQVNDYYSYRSDWANGIKFFGSSLVLKSNLKLKLYFEVDGYEAQYVQVSKGTKEVQGNYVIVTIELSSIRYLMEDVELSIYPGSGVPSGCTFKIAPSRYIAMVLNDGSNAGTDLYNVCDALALFYRGAKNYRVD